MEQEQKPNRQYYKKTDRNSYDHFNNGKLYFRHDCIYDH